MKFRITLIVCGLMLCTAVAIAQVAPASIFELDGNTFTQAPINCDWNTLNNQLTANTTTPAGTCSYNATGPAGYGFLVGSPGEPAFTTGGSKDSNDISTGGVTTSVWAWSNTSTPDKDTLTHGYGASYNATSNGDKILVFGAERFAVNGDSNIGIWFFQQQIGLTGNTKGSFTGHHAPGDILIVSAFSAGGGTSTISVYEWAPGGQTITPIQCPNSNYPNLTSSSTLPACAATNLLALFFDVSTASNSGSDAFAIVNSSNITIGWPYAAKFSVGSNTVPTGGFYEGGIDLTTLLPSGQNAPCFSSFLFETRSSQTVNAVSKDFLLGAFPQCHISITKACACTAFNPSKVEFTDTFGGVVTNDGGGNLYNVTVSDQGNVYTCVSGSTPFSSNPGSNVMYFGDSGIQPGTARCTRTTGTSDTFTSNVAAGTNVAMVSATTAPAVTSTPIGNTTGAITCTSTGTTCTPAGNITPTKQCVTTLEDVGGYVVVRVDYTGTVTNSGNVKLQSVSVTDNPSHGAPQTFNVGTLNVGDVQCYTNLPNASCPTLTPAPTTVNQSPATGVASYYPTDITNDVSTAGRAEFEDTITVTATDVYGHAIPASGAVPIQATGKCLVCPFGYCPTGSNPTGTN